MTTLPQTPAEEPPTGLPADEELENTGSIYDRTFWLAYAANVSLVMANAITFRFAEFVSWLKGTEATAGTIVSFGIIGALVLRLFLGQAIDNFGARKLWVIGSSVFIASLSVFLLVDDLSWLIYAARLGFACGLATMFTCSMVHVQNRVPANRRTEVIGNLGSSGFVGMVLGAQAGDLIFRFTAEGAARYTTMFCATVVLGGIYLALVLWLTRKDVHCPTMKTPPLHRLVIQYWPGSVVLVAMMMGMTLTVTTVFLTRYATSMNLANAVGTFFTGYAITAFLFRVQTATWNKTIGRHRMIWLGLTGHTIGMAVLPFVSQEWHFLIPAIACGFGHALLFPAVVSLGAGAFPKAYRGSGTTVTLGFIELGSAASGPVLGQIIDLGQGAGFSHMFLLASVSAVLVGVVYRLTNPADDVESIVPDPVPAGRALAASQRGLEPRMEPCFPGSGQECVSKSP